MFLTIWLVSMAVAAAPPNQALAASSSPWIETPTAATAAKGGIKVPITAGTLRKTNLNQFGESGIDLYAQYETSDQAIAGTIFVYAPTLPDVGLAYLATDETIRRRFGASTHVADDKLVDVAGVAKAGRRVIYEGVTGGTRASAALFVRAGSWIIVGRVTGPASRASEIGSNVDALIAGMTFPKGSEPLPANIIKSEPCSPANRTIDAKITHPATGEAAAFALMSEPGAVDPKGHAAINPFREVPGRLCLESTDLDGDIALQIYRTADKSGLPYSPRVYALYGDAGVMLEVSEVQKTPGSFFALRHGVGRMFAFGKLDREPSKGQMVALLKAPDEQPAFALYTSRLISPDGSEKLDLYCNMTAEGCSEDKKPAAKP